MVEPTRKELLANLVLYISLLTGLDESVIMRSKQNSPAPLGNYCSLVYVTDTADGLADTTFEEIEGFDNILNATLASRRLYTFSVQFYRDGALDLAKRFMLGIESPESQIFQQTGLFIVSAIRSITEAAIVISQNYEERAILSLDILVQEKLTQEVNKIRQIDIDVSFDGQDRVSNETIEVIDG